jgi:pimeloyl-ACP methyl ester carboxylesterase
VSIAPAGGGTSRIRYAKRGGFNIAYQVLGDGPVDLVLSPGWVTHLELAWDVPPLARFLRTLASFTRLILFDERGTGLSDRLSSGALPTLEQRVEDVLTVVDAAGAARAVHFGTLGGAAMSGLFAATHPDRVSALVLYGASVKVQPQVGLLARSADDSDAALDRLEREWGTEGVGVTVWAPSLAGDDAVVASYLRLLRAAVSPGSARLRMAAGYEINWEDVLTAIRVPTLVLHRSDDPVVPIAQGRHVADRIPAATFVELPGVDHLMWAGDQDAVIDRVRAFVAEIHPEALQGRMLATILVTDTVDAAAVAVRVPSAAGEPRSLASYRAVVRANLERFEGREIDAPGDGFLVAFRGPEQAIRCAAAILRDTRPLGLEVRAGVHSGECQVVDGGLRGRAVEVAGRVGALAGPGEVLVSRTVKDLAAGSSIDFRDRGATSLEGVEGEWQLYQASIGA